MSRIAYVFLFVVFLSMGQLTLAQTSPPDIDCALFPADSIWNTRVDSLPVHPRSAEYMDFIGLDENLHPDFGEGDWPVGSGNYIGIPYTTVDSTQPLVSITYTAYGDESDAGPFPIPLTAPIEAGSDSHVLVVDEDACMLYELFAASVNGSGGWDAESGAAYDLTSHALRPDGWTSADAAGLPILPGLLRYEEIVDGSINHAIRFTVPVSRDAYVWPARHYAGSTTHPYAPPMGLRLRLRADFDISGYDSTMQIILTAMKEYGLILADNGSSMFISGVPDERWNNDVLVPSFHGITADNFEVVDTCSFRVGADSGQAQSNANSSGGCMTATTGTIGGTVTDEATGNPLADFPVYLAATDGSTTLTLCTDSNGVYMVYDLDLDLAWRVYYDAAGGNPESCSNDNTDYQTTYYSAAHDANNATIIAPTSTHADFWDIDLALHYLGDTNRDGAVTPTDAVFVVNRLSADPNSGNNMPADINDDGVISSADFVLVVNNFGVGVP